jgi:hypothetical protein
VWTLEQAAYWQQQGQWPIPGNSPNYVEDVFSTYLYTGNGAPQAINNGIALGNGYIGGATGGSGLFDGVNDYLSVPTGTALNLSGDFTIECWVYQTSIPAYYGIFGNGDFPSSAQITATVNSGNVQLYMSNGSGWSVLLISTAAIPLFAWTHVAFTCSGSTFTIWVNGVSAGTATYSGTRATPAATSVIGRLYPATNDYYFAGNMSNLRIVKGTALYTSNFTPPSSALTAVSGTQLLCLQGSTPFVDNSANALTITNNNSTAVSSLGPFPFTAVTGKGGLVWIKTRNQAYNHYLTDSASGVGSYLSSNSTNAQNAFGAQTDDLTSFNSNGFSLGADGNLGWVNANGSNMVSWTFEKQAKFFDVVTYTGDGVPGRQIAHSLGSTPGMIIVKCTSNAALWPVYHRGVANSFLRLDGSNANNPSSARFYWGDDTSFIAPTSTVFTVGGVNAGFGVNAAGATYVAYLFAHNAGGFGASGNENVISCGSFTSNSSGGITTPVDLGFEPQWLLVKNTSADGWRIQDVMRGWSQTQLQDLSPNGAEAERALNNNPSYLSPTATGFSTPTPGIFTANNTFIYVAIRRPMAVPTVGTQVFSVTSGNFATPYTVPTGFPVDLSYSSRTGGSDRHFIDRLRGPGTTTSYRYLATNQTSAEIAGTSAGIGLQSNTSIIDNDFVTGASAVWWNFRRAPGFFDEVCYTGNAPTNTQITHNLGVAPELIIAKSRSVGGGTAEWAVYHSSLGINNFLTLNANSTPVTVSNYWSSTAPTATTFGIGSSEFWNNNGNMVAYLFATCPGVSKVGSYTGNGADGRVIDCGFTTGARFVLIKSSSNTGNWRIWDSARGIVSGNDPFLTANTSAAQTTNSNDVDTTSSGFIVNYNGLSAVNETGWTYIFLAIA